jgi:hypothetical protein
VANVTFELQYLRSSLLDKGYSINDVEAIVDRARSEIQQAFQEQSESAMSQAVDIGVEKRSPEFINDLYMDEVNMRLTTESNNMDFSTPPYPNLHNLLSGAKPMKDGSGVYKVIPIGTHDEPRKPVSASIYDAAKKRNAERAEAARVQYSKILPKGSKGAKEFRTATSKQNAATQWTLPAQDKNFQEEVESINANLTSSMDDIIRDIIQSYTDGF